MKKIEMFSMNKVEKVELSSITGGRDANQTETYYETIPNDPDPSAPWDEVNDFDNDGPPPVGPSGC